MRFIIHIGWHKTGSTSLQVFLLKNRKTLVRERRSYYSEEGLITCAHHTVAWTFQGRKTSPWGPVPIVDGGGDAYVRAAVESAKAQGCDTVIWSSEEFCALDVEAIRALYRALRGVGASVQIVAYIRRQDLLVESAYNMQVKWWGTRLRIDFDDYVKDKRAYPNYYRALKVWARVFGAGSVIVRRYEREALEQRDVRPDFCQAIGMNPQGLGHMEGSVNDSLGPSTLEFLRIMNSLDIPKEEHERIAMRLLSYDTEARSPRSVLFSPDQRRAYMAPFERGNGRLAEFGIDPAALTVGSEPLEPRNISRLSLEEFGDMLKYVSRVR